MSDADLECANRSFEGRKFLWNLNDFVQYPGRGSPSGCVLVAHLHSHHHCKTTLLSMKKVPNEITNSFNFCNCPFCISCIYDPNLHFLNYKTLKAIPRLHCAAALYISYFRWWTINFELYKVKRLICGCTLAITQMHLWKWASPKHLVRSRAKRSVSPLPPFPQVVRVHIGIALLFCERTGRAPFCLRNSINSKRAHVSNKFSYPEC